MASEPVTLGNWYEILHIADFEEAAKLANNGNDPPPWAAPFLRNWAPELINGRNRWELAGKRKDILDKLALVEAGAQQVAEVLDNPEVMKFLQLSQPFDSEMGARIFVGGLATRAREAMDSPNLLTGKGEGRAGPGRAVPPTDPDPKVLCAAIIAELWNRLHGMHPTTAHNALEAATAYWTASGGIFTRAFGNKRNNSWPPYFRRINSKLLSGVRMEMRRQLES
jgi:hypothetical protein